MLIEQVRIAYEADDYHWPAKILMTLEEQTVGGAFSWCLDSLRHLMGKAGLASDDKLARYLDELSHVGVSVSGEDLIARGESIWLEERELFHNILSQLYVALGSYKQGDYSKYRTMLVRACSLMGTHEYYRRTKLEYLLTRFEQSSEGHARREADER